MIRAARLRVFRFVGQSGTGKTTLLEHLVADLRARGLRVAVAKDSHHDVDFDQPGKDTWRFAQAGAEQVVLATDGRLTLFRRQATRPTLAEIAALIAPTADLLLAEGFRHSPEPAILVWRAALARPLPELSGPIIAVVADAPTALALPTFGFDQVPALADLLLSPPNQ